MRQEKVIQSHVQQQPTIKSQRDGNKASRVQEATDLANSAVKVPYPTVSTVSDNYLIPFSQSVFFGNTQILMNFRSTRPTMTECSATCDPLAPFERFQFELMSTNTNEFVRLSRPLPSSIVCVAPAKPRTRP